MIELGDNFECSLVSSKSSLLDWVNEHKHLEYHPMINSRVHSLGDSSGKNNILNRTFRNTYDKFLSEVSLKSVLSVADKMIFVYFLQL